MSRPARRQGDGGSQVCQRPAVVVNFAQTHGIRGRKIIVGAAGQRELPMRDVQRYRTNAAECLSAAQRCELPYRDRTLAVAEAWLSLARQQETMVELLAIWSEASAATTTVSSPQPFILATFTSRALPWFESYANQDRITRMALRHNGERET
jgi:hypothetical protein